MNSIKHITWSDINLMNLQGQCFKQVPTNALLDPKSDVNVLKVIRHSGNEIYCIEGITLLNSNMIISSRISIDALQKLEPITKEEFDNMYLPIKKEIEGTIEEADFV